MIGEEKKKAKLLSAGCLSAQKSWGSGATISTADSLCLRSSPANQNPFQLEAKQKQKQTAKEKQHTTEDSTLPTSTIPAVFFQGGVGTAIFPNKWNSCLAEERPAQSHTAASFYLKKIFFFVWSTKLLEDHHISPNYFLNKSNDCTFSRILHTFCDDSESIIIFGRLEENLL